MENLNKFNNMLKEIHEIIMSPDKSLDPPFPRRSKTGRFCSIFNTVNSLTTPNIDSSPKSKHELLFIYMTNNRYSPKYISVRGIFKVAVHNCFYNTWVKMFDLLTYKL